MGIVRQLADIDKVYEQQVKDGVVHLDELNPVADPEFADSLLITYQRDSTFSITPSCSCGRTTIENSAGKRLGDRCDYCHTEIENPLNRKLKPILWARLPEGIDGFINPIFLNMLMSAYQLNRQKSSIIQWLLDPLDKKFQHQPYIDYMVKNGVQRGISYFVRNADFIMELLNDTDVFQTQEIKHKQLYALFKAHRDILFPKHLPIINKQFLMVENTHIGTYIDMNTVPAFLKAINTFIGMNIQRNQTQAKRDSITAKFLMQMCDFHVSIIKNDLQSKKGLFRRHVVSSRSPFTARAVVTSLHGSHDYNEIHFPWSLAVVLFEVHIHNHLMKRGYSPRAMRAKTINAVKCYDKEIDEIMEQIIADSPFRTELHGKPGYPVIEQRNPSLKMASMMCFLITYIKKDPSDVTKSLSILGLGGSNTDFDGDMTNTLIPTDLYTAYSLYFLSPWHQVMSFGNVDATSGDMNLSKQSIATFNHFMQENNYGKGDVQ